MREKWQWGSGGGVGGGDGIGGWWVVGLVGDIEREDGGGGRSTGGLVKRGVDRYPLPRNYSVTWCQSGQAVI